MLIGSRLRNICNQDKIWSNCVNIGRLSDPEPKKTVFCIACKSKVWSTGKIATTEDASDKVFSQSSQLWRNSRNDPILATYRDNDRPICVFAANQWIYLFKHDAKSGHQPGFFKQTIFWWITAMEVHSWGELKTGTGTKGG